MGKKKKEKQEEQISLWSRIKNASKKAKAIAASVIGCVLIAGVIISNINTYEINGAEFSIDKNSDVLYQTQLVEQISEIIKQETGYEAQKGDIAESLIVDDYKNGGNVHAKVQNGLLDTIEVNGVIVEENTPEKVEEVAEKEDNINILQKDQNWQEIAEAKKYEEGVPELEKDLKNYNEEYEELKEESENSNMKEESENVITGEVSKNNEYKIESLDGIYHVDNNQDNEKSAEEKPLLMAVSNDTISPEETKEQSNELEEQDLNNITEGGEKPIDIRVIRE